MDSSVSIACSMRARSGALQAAAPASAARSLLRPRALIVDDCRFIAERLARVLEARGFECTIVSDGYAGLALIHGVRFDLFVVDVNVPFVDGFAVLRQIRGDSVHATTPVLMLAARHAEADREHAEQLGASGYLIKPLQLRSLTAMLDSMMV